MRKPRFKADEKLEVKDLPERGGGEAKTDWILPDPTFDMQQHDWVQRGIELSCESCAMKHATFIPQGKTLYGEKGAWRLEDTPVFRG